MIYLKVSSKSSKKVVLEEFLIGEEASYFVIVDNNNFKFSEPLKIIKSFENDKGPNTGGMGAYSPAPVIDKSLEKKIISQNYKANFKYS